MDSIQQRQKLVASCQKALVELDKVINQVIEDIDPEKAKIAVQGKVEAIVGYDKILGIISMQLITIENEQNAKEGSDKVKAFDGVEQRSK